MKVVFLTTMEANRSAYREQALATWEQVDKTGVEFEVLTDPKKWGIEEAGRQAIHSSLNGHNFGIVAFDDMLVAPDVLDYFRWAQQFEHNERIITVGAWSTSHPTSTDDYYAVTKDQCYHCGVYGTWHDKWYNDLEPEYTGEVINQRGMDQQYTDHIFPEKGWYEMRPVWSRAQTIGAYGIHMRPHMLAEHQAGPWAGDTPAPEGPQEWYWA